MWDANESLREQNRSLISQLLRKQETIIQTTKQKQDLHKRLDTLQQELDRICIFETRSQPHVLNGSESVTRANSNNNNICERPSSADVQSPRNVNNNNVSQYRKSACVSPRYEIDDHRLGSALDPDYSMSVNEIRSMGASPKLAQGQPEVIEVTRSSPQEAKDVRRKHAGEMQTSKTHLLTSYATGPKLSDPGRCRENTRTQVKEVHVSRTPKQTSSRFGVETPKSILKHRKLIDSNVQVDSKFAHTPGWMDRAKRTRLRQTLPSPQATPTKSGKKNQKKKRNTRKLPSFNKTEIDHLKAVSFLSDGEFQDPTLLRTDYGNLRSQTSESPIRTPDKDISDEVDPDTMVTPASLSQVRPSPLTSGSKQRMMGYDWIAALLDQPDMSHLSDKHEAYFRELKEFRRLHRDECQNDVIGLPGGAENIPLITSDSIANPLPEPASPSHTCIHSYTVNDRLYTIPVHKDSAGDSRCGVCNKKKTTPSTQSPGFVRISIPRTTLSSPYKIKPHRRKSFDPSDSVALSKHCLAGWVNPRPVKLPLGRNVDLANETNRLKNKFFMTMAEAEDLARKSKSVPIHSRDLDQTTLYNKEVKKITNQLVDMSNAMNFQSQLFKKTPLH